MIGVHPKALQPESRRVACSQNQTGSLSSLLNSHVRELPSKKRSHLAQDPPLALTHPSCVCIFLSGLLAGLGNGWALLVFAEKTDLTLLACAFRGRISFHLPRGPPGSCPSNPWFSASTHLLCFIKASPSLPFLSPLHAPCLKPLLPTLFTFMGKSQSLPWGP